MKLLVRLLVAVIATMTLSGCMIMMAPMLLWHGSHLKKKHQHGKPEAGEVCECCRSRERPEPQTTPMGDGDREASSIKTPALDPQ